MEDQKEQKEQKEEEKHQKTVPNPKIKVPHISEITNNPNLNFMSTIYSFITETFGNLSYNPNLTEDTVPPSPDIPIISLADLDDNYKKIFSIYRAMNHNHSNKTATTTAAPETHSNEVKQKFYKIIPPVFFSDTFKCDQKFFTPDPDGKNIVKLHEFLELAENNLIEIIKEKHEDIQDAFVSLGNLHDDVAIAFDRIAVMKVISKDMRMKMFLLKRKRLRKKKLLETLKAVNEVKQGLSSIEKNLAKNDISPTIDTYSQILKLYEEKLKRVKSAEQFKGSLAKCRQKIQTQLQIQFEQTFADILNSKFSIANEKPGISEDAMNYIKEALSDNGKALSKALDIINSAWKIDLCEELSYSSKIVQAMNDFSRVEGRPAVTKVLLNLVNKYLGQMFMQIILYMQSYLKINSTEMPELTNAYEIAMLLVLVYFACFNLHYLSTNLLLVKEGETNDNKYPDQYKEVTEIVKSFLTNKIQMFIKTIKLTSINIQEYCNVAELFHQFMNLMVTDLEIRNDEVAVTLNEAHKKFLGIYSISKLEDIQRTLDKEKWKAVEVPQKFIGLIEHLHNPGSDQSPSSNIPETVVPNLVSDEIHYWSTESLLLLLTITYEYTQLISSVPAISYEGASNMLDTIKMFNTKSRHLVLEGGAMQLGTLKYITVEHLALCSESVSFLIAEIPHLKGRIELVLQSDKKEFIEETITMLKSALGSHRDCLFAKISSTISSRYKEYLEATNKATINTTPKPSAEAANLILELNQIYTAISKLLPYDRVSLIFQEAFNEIAIAFESSSQTFQVIGEAKAKQFMKDLSDIDNAINALNIPEHSKGIRKRIRTLIDQLTLKFLQT